MKKPDNLWARIRTGVIIAIVIIVTFFFAPSGVGTKVLLTLTAILAYKEWKRISRSIHARDEEQGKGSNPIPTITIAVLGIGLVSILAINQRILGLILVSAPAYDVFAYLIGRKIGHKIIKRRPFPDTSEKKSWEGLVSGVLTSIAFSLIYLTVWTYTVDGYLLTWRQVLALLPIHFCMAATAAAGDYLCSRLKRAANIDDSDARFIIKLYPRHRGIAIDTSKIIPGHGGIMDRCLSIFAVATIMLVPTLSSSALSLLF